MAAITKDQAQAWIGATRRQRSLKRSAVQRMTDDMNNGRWVAEVSPPIFISTAGEVVDGMHRLTALLATTNGFTLHADVRVVDRKHIEVIDTGTPRSLQDTLQILEYENPKELSALINTVARWQTGQGASNIMTRTEQVEWLRSNPNATFAADAAKRLAPTKHVVVRIPTGTTAALWDIATYAEGAEAVEEFTDAMQMGNINMDVARRFTHLYLESKNNRSKSKVGFYQLSLLTVRVYLAWLVGDDVSKLFARRSVVRELPGYDQWANTNWKEKK